MRARVGPVCVVNTYVPQGRSIDHPLYAYKLEWLRRLKAYFSRHFTPGDWVLWVGDLNVAPEAADIHNAEAQANHVCYHRDVRQVFADTVAWGFVDCLRLHHPEPGQYTFFDYRTRDAVQRNLGWRIDHLLATVPLAQRCRDCRIDLAPRRQSRASDHTVLLADFDVGRTTVAGRPRRAPAASKRCSASA